MAYSNNFNGKDNNGTYGKRPYDRNFKRPANVNKVLTLGSSDKYDSTLNELATLIRSIPFSNISIPVTISKSVAFNNDEARGFVTVGFIKSFSDGKFDVTILNKFDEKVPTGSVVVPKIKTTREGIPTFIVAFSIEDGAPARISEITSETELTCDCDKCECDCETTDEVSEVEE